MVVAVGAAAYAENEVAYVLVDVVAVVRKD